jgi:membrane protease YdiL (CAAX protease family)
LSAEEVVLTFAAVSVLGAIVVAANYALSDAHVRSIVTGLLAVINGLIVLVYGVMQVAMAYSGSQDNVPQKGEAWGALVLSLTVAGLATALLFYPVRERLRIVFPSGNKRKLTEQNPEPPKARLSVNNTSELKANTEGSPLFPQMLNYYTTDSIVVPRPLAGLPVAPASIQKREGYNPHSTVHMVALVLCLYMLGVQFINFVLGGGLKGVAESFKGGITGWDLLANFLPLLILPLLGVGLGMRRNLQQTLQRLGLTVPSVESIMVAFGITIALFVFVASINFVWMGVVSEETYKEQTQASDAVSESVTTIGLAFLMAATAAVGEEIAFRGALQPIFGLWPTAVLFALTHAQYTLTPAVLIIFGVAVAFGWIRHRYNTTVAILTHFMYDFIPLAVFVTAPQAAVGWLIHLL